MPTPDQRHLRILHLEDTSLDAELTLAALRPEWPECEVVHVGNRAAFLAAIRHGSFDAVLSDFNLPDFDGFAALEETKIAQPGVPFILFTGTIGDEMAVALLKAGASDYVLKDRPARLVPALQRAFRDRADQRSREAAEQSVRDTEERFRQLAEASNDVFWFSDLDPFQPRYISPGVERLWGRKAEEFYATPSLWLTTIHPDDRLRVEQNFNAWLAGERVLFQEEFRVVRPDGTTRWVHDTGTFNSDSMGRVRRMSGVARDVTTVKEAAEHSLRAQRLESIGLLAGGVAHDLNNALAPILMGLHLMRPQLPEPMLPLYRQMETSVNRGAAMVRQLLGFARGASGQKSVLEPKRVVQEVVDLAQSTFPKSIVTTLVEGADVPKIEIDATLLHQLVLNLCVNARDAMPNGGSLTLGLEAAHVDESYAGFIAEAKPGHYLVLTVTDSGVGMSPEVLAKIFDPFFTTKAAGAGTGLGLTTVAGIAHNHGGFIRVYSEVGQGTTFKVYLPGASGHATPVAAGSTAEYQAQGEKVLVVDDEESVRFLLQSLLERFGFETIAAADGTAAVAAFMNHRESVKLVITDVQMPNLDGLALVRVFRQLASDLPIIVMSGLHSDVRVREFAALGVQQFLFKPFAIAKLTEALQATLGGRAQSQLRLES